ncbi:hypothetical protein MACH07_02170 [Flagellimonas marinaquae]|uniref:Uncharacterized protein n=1 Tax=Flagellimonas marinaquae TaxID=254955 RepID=A0AA48KMQ8_9FLAO|nr:hypothetical protein MACH07_02170 [Allomuricauda aquimarina]
MVESDVECDGSQKLHNQREVNDTFNEILYLDAGGHGELCSNDLLVPSGYTLCRKEQVVGGQGHVPNPSQLNKDHDNELSKEIIGVKNT